MEGERQEADPTLGLYCKQRPPTPFENAPIAIKMEMILPTTQASLYHTPSFSGPNTTFSVGFSDLIALTQSNSFSLPCIVCGQSSV